MPRRSINDDQPEFRYLFSAEDIARLRDTEQLSWAKVATALDLGSPGGARRAYSLMVRPHTESVLDRSKRSADLEPVTLDVTRIDLVKNALEGRTLVVERNGELVNIPCLRVTSIKGDTVNFNDGDKSRSVKAAAVIGTK
jgi:hypothetical protein